MVAQTTRLNIKRSDVPAVLLAARTYPHKCLVAPCLSSNPATDGSASSKMQNLKINLKVEEMSTGKQQICRSCAALMNLRPDRTADTLGCLRKCLWNLNRAKRCVSCALVPLKNIR